MAPNKTEDAGQRLPVSFPSHNHFNILVTEYLIIVKLTLTNI